MLQLNQSGTWYHEDPYDKPPFNGPYFIIACLPYSEHVGLYLHLGGNIGDITF